jgi:alkylation response protein AidB-like acyl-CoA dehydrogenase
MNTELIQLADSARQVVAGLGLAGDEQETSSLITELGWLMVSVPEEQGGLGLGLAGASALHHELGRGLATVPFLSQMLGIEAVSRGELTLQADWLESLMAGERRVTASLGATAASIEQAEGGDLKLNGSASAVPCADRASHALIESPDNDIVALVALEQPGLTVTARPTWDVTRRLFDLEMTDLPLDPKLIIAKGETASLLCQRLGILRDFALAADAVGGAAALLEMTVEYLQTRQQFGRPLALFQALKHRCADLKASSEGAQALLQDSIAGVVDSAGEVTVTAETEMKARAAKQLACSAYASVAEESLQLHGGIGMTSEHDCHLFLKRALLNEHLGRRQDSYEQGLADLFLDSLA